MGLRPESTAKCPALLAILGTLSLFSGIIGCARPCMGTPWSIYNTCGCNPRDEAFITRVLSLDIPNVAINEVRRCANGDLSLGTQSKNVVGTTKLCIERSQKIDLQSRVRILAELDVADNETNLRPQECENWRKCYAKKTGVSADEAELRAAKERIQAMESKVKQLETEKAALQKSLESANLAISQDAKQIQVKEAELVIARTVVATMKDQLNIAQSNNLELKAKLEQAQSQVKKLEDTKQILELLAKNRQSIINLDKKKISLLEEEAQVNKNSMSTLCRKLDKELGMPEVCTALERGEPRT